MGPGGIICGGGGIPGPYIMKGGIGRGPHFCRAEKVPAFFPLGPGITIIGG